MSIRIPFVVLLWALWLPCLACSAASLEGTEAGLELHPIEQDEDWQLALINGTGQHVDIGCSGHDGCNAPPLRIEALQPDGRWVVRAGARVWTWRRRPPLAPGEDLLLGLDAFGRATVAPGTYRAVARVVTDDGRSQEIARRYAVAGWETRALEQAEDLRRRAHTLGCGALGEAIRRMLIDRLEHHLLVEMHERERSEPRRRAIELEMLKRGGLVHFLSRRLQHAPRGHVRRAAEWLRLRPDAVQEPLRPVVARRLTDPLFARGAALEKIDYRLIADLEGYWPAGTAEQLVERLERGPETGETLGALLEVIYSSRPETFEAHADRILAALEVRCEGANEALARECRCVRRRLDPDDWGGCGSSWVVFRCGGSSAPNRSPGCVALRDRWQQLVDRQPPLHPAWLRGEVDPEGSADR